MGQFLDEIFECEFLVSFLGVENNTFHLVIDSLVLEVLYPLLSDLLSPLHLLLMSVLVDATARAGPLVPASLHFDGWDLAFQVIFDFILLFSFELIVNFIVVFGNKKFLHVELVVGLVNDLFRRGIEV